MEKRNRQCSCGLPRILPWFQSPLIGWRHESEKDVHQTKVQQK